MNKKFADPNADIGHFVERFENEARDIYAKRQNIIGCVSAIIKATIRGTEPTCTCSGSRSESK